MKNVYEMNPLVSVIVPVYKVEPYLEACVNSILAQTYTNLEVILVDDGSPDRCGAICDEYAVLDVRVKVIHKQNGGLSDARNAGLDVCTGDYVAFIDSDDLWDTSLIEYLLGMALKYGAEYSCCQVSEFIDGQQPDYTYHDTCGKSISQELALQMSFYQQIETNVMGKLFHRSLFSALRFPIGKRYEDLYTIYFALSQAKCIAYGSDARCGYRIRTSSQSQSTFTSKEMDCIDAAEELYHDVRARFPKLLSAVSCRAFSANLHIFFMIPKGSYDVHLCRIWGNVKRYRKTVLLDIHARPKARAAALVSFLGCNLFHITGYVLLNYYNDNSKRQGK